MYKYILGIICVLAALIAGAWYFFAAPIGAPLARGVIEGTTLYPSEYVPAQRVCAEPIGGGSKYCDDAPESEGNTAPTFHITVPPGTYYVYASLKDPSDLGSNLGGFKAYYTKFVTCGLRYDCADHGKIPVDVEAGQTVSGIAPHDWYSGQ